MSFMQKLKGDGNSLPPAPSKQAIMLAWLGGFLTIALLAKFTDLLSASLLLGSFGASCALVFGYPDAPFSQPRNVIIGHFLSSLVGLVFLKVFGYQWWSVALALGTAIALMMLTRTVHPPAGSNPVIIFLTHPSWQFLLFPTLVGTIIIVLIALVYNNLTRKTNYPKYW